MSGGFSHLALSRFVPDLEKALFSNKNILLSAPTGSGKSIYFPYFLSERFSGKIVILEPRRLVAKELARYMAKCLGEPCGKTVGYKFRLEQCKSEQTRIIFQTYGNYLQEILHHEENADWILFDEFHERKAEMDLLLAYYVQKQKQNSHLRLAVMSAKLNSTPIAEFLNTELLETGIPLYPVQIIHQSSAQKKSLEDSICQALRTLQINGIWKTTLVFLPGKAEIKKAKETVEESFGKAIETFELYSGQSDEIQEKIFTLSESPRVVFTTNIAETSLTVPDVSGVIDSGYERLLEHSKDSNIPVLRISRITLQNAIQRTGRAGRLEQGTCIRLWSKEEEKSFQENIIPEILRINPQEFLLKKIALAEKLSIKASEMLLLTEIPKEKKDSCLFILEKSGFIQQETLTELGKESLEVSLENIKLLELFLKVRFQNPVFIAMLAWLDAGNEFFFRSKETFSLKNLAETLVENSKSVPREVEYTFRKLLKFAQSKNFKNLFTEDIPKTMLEFFSENLAIRNGESFKLQDKQMLRLKIESAKAILAFALVRTGNINSSELRTGAYLEIPETLIYTKEDSIHYELLWQNSKERFIGIAIRESHGKEIARTEIIPQETDENTRKNLASLCSAYWKEKISKENLSHLWLSAENQILFYKMKLAAQYFPEYNLPLWNDEDMDLIAEVFFDSIFLKKDLTPERYRNIIEDYFGKTMISWLHKNFPDYTTLLNGKRAKYIYQEDVVEISARLGDFIGTRGKHFIAENKIPVRYDVLAPNYRSVQKTWDLDSFWINTYPEIRKELRGRYPKHPWPEKIL